MSGVRAFDGRLVKDLRAIGGSEGERAVQLAAQLGAGERQAGQVLRGLARNQVGPGGSGQRLRIGVRRKVVHADAGVVHQPRAERPRVIQHRLLDRENVAAGAAVGEGLAIHDGIVDVLLRVARKEVVIVGGRPIHFDVALVAVSVILHHIVEVVDGSVRQAGQVRLGQRRGDLQRRRADARDAGIHPHLLPRAADGRLREVRGHRHGGAGIVQRDPQVRQVAGGVLRGEGGLGSVGGRQIESRPLVIGEEEQLVALDGAAESAAVLVPALAAGWAAR